MLFVCSVLIFALGRLLPGDPVSFIAGSESTLTREQVDAIRRDYGLDYAADTEFTVTSGATEAIFAAIQGTCDLDRQDCHGRLRQVVSESSASH